MPRATVVRLPIDKVPRMPDFCCACLREGPGDWHELIGRRWRLSDILWPWPSWHRRQVRCRVPMCRTCRQAMVRLRRWRGALILTTAVVAGGGTMLWNMWSGHSEWRQLQAMGTALVALLPLIVWQAQHPPAFDLSVGTDHVRYAFANEHFAARFRAVN